MATDNHGETPDAVSPSVPADGGSVELTNLTQSQRETLFKFSTCDTDTLTGRGWKPSQHYRRADALAREVVRLCGLLQLMADEVKKHQPTKKFRCKRTLVAYYEVEARDEEHAEELASEENVSISDFEHEADEVLD